MFLTHPHPDHFGGIDLFVHAGGGCSFYASRQTHDSIAEDRMGFIEKSREVVGDDFPEIVTLPDTILTMGQTVAVDGLTIETREMGAGEAECMTVLYLPNSGDPFASDIIQNKMTAFLLEGRLDAWLGRIEALRHAFPNMRTIYPGHGPSGTPEALISYQRRYLETFKGFIAEERKCLSTKPWQVHVATVALECGHRMVRGFAFSL